MKSMRFLLLGVLSIQLMGCATGGNLVPKEATVLDTAGKAECESYNSKLIKMSLCREQHYTNSLHERMDEIYSELETPTYDSMLLGAAILSSGAATANAHVSVLKGLAWGTSAVIGGKDYIQPDVKRNLLKDNYQKSFCLKNSSDLAFNTADDYYSLISSKELQELKLLNSVLTQKLSVAIPAPAKGASKSTKQQYDDLVSFKNETQNKLNEYLEIESSAEAHVKAFEKVPTTLSKLRGKLIADLRTSWANSFGNIDEISAKITETDTEEVPLLEFEKGNNGYIPEFSKDDINQVKNRYNDADIQKIKESTADIHFALSEVNGCISEMKPES